MGIDARILGAALTLAVLGSGSAFGADLAESPCDCFVSTAAAKSDVPVGTLREVNGRVVVTGLAAPRRGAAGEGVFLNESVSTGPRSNALVRVGHCEKQLDAEQELTIRRSAGGICLVASGARPGTFAYAPGFSARYAALGLGALALGGGIVAIAQSNDNDDIWFTFGDDQPISR